MLRSYITVHYSSLWRHTRVEEDRDFKEIRIDGII